MSEEKLRKFLHDEIEFGRANSVGRDEYNTAYFKAIEAIAKRMLLMLDDEWDIDKLIHKDNA